MEKDLNLIIGRAGTGKTNEILERVREDIKRDENVYLIVPEQFSYTFEKKITDFFSSVLNVQIVSFSRLVDQILNDSKFKNKVYIDDISRNIILENVLGKLDLKILKNKEKNIDAISNMIEEFKKYNINIENLNSYILEEKQKGINHSILKLEEIYNIYVEYNKEIEEKYLDIADKENEVLNIIEKENSFAGYKIYIDQFYKFTYGEYNLIEKMLKQADEVNLAITADSIHKKSDYEVFSTTKNTISQIIQIAQTNNISTNIITKDKNLKHDEEIQNFEKALFEENSINENITKEDNIKLRVYKNIEDELEDLAENIMQEIIEKKYNYSDIAVVYNDLENQENLIRRIFDKYNIPIIIDSEKKLEQNSMARYILDLLEILYSNYSISSVFSFLKLGYSNFDLEDIYLLEKYVLRWRVRGSKWKSEWKNYDKLNDEDFNGIIKVKEEFVQFIEGIKTKLTKSKTSKDISLLIYNLIEEQDIFNKAINNINDLKISDNQKLELLNEYTVSLNLLRESLDRIVSIKQDDIISYEKYYDIFKIILRETSIKQIPSVNDAIHFITSKTLNMEDIKSLYIIALEDGLYPMLPSYKGIINDEEKLILRANNINLSETDIERLADDDFNMYSIFMIPSTSIYMSYHISTLKGDSKRVSIYVNKIKRKLKYLEEETRIKGLYKEVPRIYSEKALLEKVLSKYLEYLEGKKIEDEWKYLIYILQNSSDEFVLIEKNILNKNIAPNISMEILEKIFRQDLHTSVSRLEEYAKCPFAYFARYTLNLQEEKKYELNPLNTGTLLHDVLQEFVDQIKDKKISLDAINSKLLFIQDNEILKLKKGNEEYNKDFNETMEEIDKITDDIINKKLEEDKYKIFKFSPKFEFLTEKFREEIKKATKVVLNTLRLSDFEVLGNEININADFKKSKYPLANNRFTQIYGQIDRADIYKRGDDTYLRIVDYKSSANHLDENKIKAGLQLQLLTYMDVLAKEKEYLPSATLYFGLETPIKNLSKKDLKEIEKAEEINYKMTGLVLADEEIVRAMDKSLETGNSDILPVGFKKDGDFRADSRIKDANEFEELRKIVSKNIISMSENILQGDISIYPYKYKDETGCKYCPYKSICQFNIKKNRYRRINK